MCGSARWPASLSLVAAVSGLAALVSGTSLQPTSAPAAPASSTSGASGPHPVSGFVFDDGNRDGRRQDGEDGLSGVVVSNQVDVTTTGPDGAYVLPSSGTGVAFVSLPRGRAASASFWKAVGRDGKALDFGLVSIPDRDDFSFIHGSDPHVHEDTVARLRAFLSLLDARQPAFALMTGDLIRDALRVGEAEATRLFELYIRETTRATTTIWNAPGNHETFGIERHHSLVAKTHPLYGKAMYRRYLGPNYYSFNRGGIHFIALDTVDTEDLWYLGRVDPRQLEWLAKDLATIPKGSTVVTFNHIPFVSGRTFGNGYTDAGVAPSLVRVGDKMQYRHIVSNIRDVLARFKDHDFTLSLSGHNHAFERLQLLPHPGATRFHLTAAITGPTTELAPSPSGVTLYRVRGTSIDDGEFIELPAPARPR